MVTVLSIEPPLLRLNSLRSFYAAIRRLGGEVKWTDVFVVHAGADDTPEGRQRKYERDLRILRLEHQERPDHPFVLFNLGMTYADMKEYKTAEAICAVWRCPGARTDGVRGPQCLRG